MLKIILFAFLSLFLFSQRTIAQELQPAVGNVKVIQDDKITQLTEQYRNMNLFNPETDGYRVQIFFDAGTNSKNKALTAKSEFETTYPDTKTYLSYKEPYYRVRVGDFRTLTEAVGFQKKINDNYPNSFPVKDKIVL
jgi:hypothetical protein